LFLAWHVAGVEEALEGRVSAVSTKVVMDGVINSYMHACPVLTKPDHMKSSSLVVQPGGLPRPVILSCPVLWSQVAASLGSELDKRFSGLYDQVEAQVGEEGGGRDWLDHRQIIMTHLHGQQSTQLESKEPL
jgi:hypothetical protein